MKPATFSALALILLLPLAACSQSPQNDPQPGGADHVTSALKDAGENISPSAISGEIRKGIEEAKRELASENIDINSIHINRSRHDDDSRPKAQITPRGDLLIADKQVSATPEQHALLSDYRTHIVGIAGAGMDIGVRGADLGLNAAKQALLGSFSGKSDNQIEAAIKPQTDRIQSAALALCKRLPALLSSQQKLAAAMPEFRPYATMQQKDVDDCGKGMTDSHGKKGFAVFSD
jgi:hypothetical protein